VKYLISFLFLALCFSVKAQVQYREGTAEDTLTNAETAYLYPADAATAAAATDFKEYGTLEVVIVSDSLSGATAGTSVLQYCYDDACTVTYDAATLTLNGAAQQVSRTEDAEFSARKWRIKNTGSGTMSNRIRVYYTWKRKT
jgi:hypothetical protein